MDESAMIDEADRNRATESFGYRGRFDVVELLQNHLTM
jgi:hypothetical protein